MAHLLGVGVGAGSATAWGEGQAKPEPAGTPVQSLLEMGQGRLRQDPIWSYLPAGAIASSRFCKESVRVAA